MRRDQRVIIMGEDISGGTGAPGDQDAWGGPLGVTKGLRPEFGPERVLDTHLAEISFVGAAAGAAATGLRPIVELMFVDFMGVCFDQIFNQAAKFRYMFGGKAVTPLVVRTMYGAGFRAASQHSQCLYPIFTHIPGLKVVLPSNAYEAKGLLIQAIRDDDPGDLLRAQGHVRHGDGGARRGLRHPLRRGERHARGRRRDDRGVRADGEFRQRGGRQSGEEGHFLHRRRPAHHLAARHRDDSGDGARRPGGWSWSTRRIRAAAWRPTSPGWWRRRRFDALKAPIKLVTAPHAPVPFSPALEDLYIPSVAKIEAAVAETMDYGAKQAAE